MAPDYQSVLQALRKAGWTVCPGFDDDGLWFTIVPPKPAAVYYEATFVAAADVPDELKKTARKSGEPFKKGDPPPPPCKRCGHKQRPRGRKHKPGSKGCLRMEQQRRRQEDLAKAGQAREGS